MKGRFKRGKALEGWEEERKMFYEERGWTLEEMVRDKRKGGE